LIIDLDACLIYKHARQLLQYSELFGPPLSPTLAKMHEGVSLLTNFSELKFHHKFRCPFDRKAYTPTFATLQAIFTPFNPNLGETARWSFAFDQFLRMKIVTYI